MSNYTTYKDLVFFNKAGKPYNFKYDAVSDSWSGNIFIKNISKGLFETEKLIVMQKYIIKASSMQMSDNKELVDPSYSYIYGMPSTILSSANSIVFRWEENNHDVDEIQMYKWNGYNAVEDTSSLHYFEYDNPQIEFSEQVVIENLDSNVKTEEPVSIKHIDIDEKTTIHIQEYTNNGYTNKSAVIDLCFCNVDDDYNTFRRDLFMYEATINTNGENIPTGKLIGKFTVYAESIEEDERLTSLCQTLGYDILNSEFDVFKYTDIKEQKIDYELMNLKRKEALLEGHNIYSYIGSYKSLLNAIKFFGYTNISVREWWKNIDTTSVEYGKYFLASTYSLDKGEVIRHHDDIITLPNKKYNKTNMMSLVWKVNDLSPEMPEPEDESVSGPGWIVDENLCYDVERYGRDAKNVDVEHPLPYTTNLYLYSIEEAVIKLYGLKRILEKKFLPLNCHLVDITGDVLSFSNTVVTHYASSAYAGNVDTCRKASFSVFPKENIYIEDLRPFLGGEPGVQRVREIQGIRGFQDISLQEFNTDFIVLQGVSAQMQFYQGSYGIQICTGEQGIQGIQGYRQIPINELPLSQRQTIQGLQGFQWYYDEYAQRVDSTERYYGVQGLQGAMNPITYYGNKSLYGVYGNSYDYTTPWDYYTYSMSLVKDDVTTANQGVNLYLANFSDYAPNVIHNSPKANTFDYDPNIYLPDTENIPVGALVHLSIDKTIDMTWDDIDDRNWNEFIYANWNTIGECANYSRVCWTIVKDENEYSPEFYAEIYGEIKYGYGDIAIVLPYIGKYSVKCQLYDWHNNISSNLQVDCVEVEPKQVEVSGWYEKAPETLTWNSNMTWDEAEDVTWSEPYYNNDIFENVDSASYESLSRETFIHEYTNTTDPNESMIYYAYKDMSRISQGPYTWSNMREMTWNDLDHLNWDITEISGDTPCYFEFGYFDDNGKIKEEPQYSLAGNYLEIVTHDRKYGLYRFDSGKDINTIVDDLNNYTDAAISQYTYSKVFIKSDTTSQTSEDDEHDNGFKIIAIAKNYGTTGDYEYVSISRPNELARIDRATNALILRENTDPDNELKCMRFKTLSVNCNPTWLTLHSLRTFSVVGKATDINLNYSACKINGKKNPRWTVKNISDETVPIVYSDKKHFHYVFKKTGCYNVKLELQDTNGNNYYTERNMFVIR